MKCLCGQLGELFAWAVDPNGGVLDSHLFFYDRFSDLAEYHRLKGRTTRADRLAAIAEAYYRAAPDDDEPREAAAMAMPVPRPPVNTNAVSTTRVTKPARGTTNRFGSITCSLTGSWTAIRMRYLMLPSLIVLILSPLVGQEPTFDLSDQDCRGEVLISLIEGARVYASCVSAGPERIMHVSVAIRRSLKWERCETFRLDFVVRA